ncbi:Uncharacterised protein [uncultured archaeon]|nr:Uncharacterised protein [uncultured archaeon]
MGNNWKYCIALFALLLAGYITSAATISEQDFKSQGKQDFYISDSNVFSCKDFDVSLPADTNAEIFPVFSLRAKFLPSEAGNPLITLFINSQKEAFAEYRPADFRNGVARIVLPFGTLRVGDNTIRVCGKAAPGNSIWITADSTFGLYEMPYFPKEGGLEFQLESTKPRVKVPFDIIAVARNFGSVDAPISLSYRRIDLREALPEASVLGGETSKTGVVEKCREWSTGGKCAVPGELRISYKAVANKAVPMSLLPAVMVFMNAFGEEEQFISNRPAIEAIDSNRVSGQVLLENDKAVAGQKMPLKIVLKNTGVQARGIKVTLRTGMEISGQDSQEVPVLNEGQSQELRFEAGATQPGNYEISCLIEYEGEQYSCPGTTILVEKPALSIEMAGALLLTLAGLGVLAYFYYFKKDYPA